MITRFWNTNAYPSLPGLLHLWKIEQLQGNNSIDLVSGKKIYLPLFNKPTWEFSDLPIPNKKLNEEFTVDISSNLTLAEEFCTSVILSGPLYNNCVSLGPAAAGFYFRVCVSEVTLTNNISMALEAVIAFADYCEDVLDLNYWPARELCDLFSGISFPNWIGPKCNHSCVFGSPGMKNGSLVCVCEHGYWGATCDGLCPGGIWNVCSKNGICNTLNGTCTCDPRWRGETTNVGNHTTLKIPCSVCTSGWYNKNCSISIEKEFSNSSYLNNKAICVAFGDPHVTTFSRASYHLDINGPFTAFRSRSSEMEILEAPCPNSVKCKRIKEITLNSQALNISMRSSGVIFTNLSSTLTSETTLR